MTTTNRGRLTFRPAISRNRTGRQGEYKSALGSVFVHIEQGTAHLTTRYGTVGVAHKALAGHPTHRQIATACRKLLTALQVQPSY